MSAPGPPSTSPPAVAFIDVDGTLLAETTTYLFARILRRRGLIKRSFILRAALSRAPAPARPARLRPARRLRPEQHRPASRSRSSERIACENFEEHVKPRLYEGVVEHLDDLKAPRGRPSSWSRRRPGSCSSRSRIYLGCTDTITTPVRIERGRLVGIAEGPPCYGEGKLYWARQWAEAREIAMDEAAAYADNWSDRALLGQVGRAVVVHPHRKLKRLALARGWTIVRSPTPRRSRRPGNDRRG